MTSHAKLSASASKRWMSCPPSVALEANFPDKTTSYAEEGTKAHGLGELLLRVELGGNDGADIAEAQAYSAECSKEMQDAVDVYVDLVLEKFNAAKAISSDAVLLLEQKLNFSKWVPEGFGTGDAIIIADGMCEIIDYKHGKGVQVSAENNSQMRLYALGAYSMYDLFYGIEHVTMTIVQPRKDNISSESMDIKELLIWAKKDVAPKAKLAWAGKGEFKAGDHCQFCRAGATCTARAEQIFQPIQAFDRDDPKLLDDYDIATLLELLPPFIKWAKTVTDYAFNEALAGKAWPGWKLVEGRSNRAFTDAGQVEKTLLANEYKEAVIKKPAELLGVKAIEDLLGKRKFAELLSDFIVKPPGKPALVAESDKREAINVGLAAAQAAFEEEVSNA